MSTIPDSVSLLPPSVKILSDRIEDEESDQPMIANSISLTQTKNASPAEEIESGTNVEAMHIDSHSGQVQQSESKTEQSDLISLKIDVLGVSSEVSNRSSNECLSSTELNANCKDDYSPSKASFKLVDDATDDAKVINSCSHGSLQDKTKEAEKSGMSLRNRNTNNVQLPETEDDQKHKGDTLVNTEETAEDTQTITTITTEATSISSSSLTNISKDVKKKEDEELDVSLIPKCNSILSDYNMLLTKNIELFKVKTEGTAYSKGITHGNGSPMEKVGLRCIHCRFLSQPITAASFFPSSVNSISSGIGTIGARHFIGGKCPLLPSETLDKLKQFKKISQQQTRTQGRISLDAHCKELAKREQLIDLGTGGIQLDKDIDRNIAVCHDGMYDKTNKISKISSSSSLESHSNQEESVIDINDPSAFVEGDVEYFWECKHCKHLPYQWRASGSVVFSCDQPSIAVVGTHLKKCHGKKPLLIPRDARVETKEVQNNTSVFIKWENFDKSSRKSTRIKRRAMTAESAKKRRKLSPATIVNVKKDVEDVVLVTPEDKALTTDFAHFTVMQLKKCYLTKSGGSRGNCPLGYPGLACSHCAGTVSARRFFYTSADHLRNSFSHIPSHLAICTKCPESVKQKISELKLTRSKQKGQLKNGDHKKFIDGLWEKLHGPGGGVFQIEDEQEKNVEAEDICDDSSTVSSLSDEGHAEFQRLKSRNCFWHETDHLPIRPSSSEIVSGGDRKEVTDYTYYTMLQMIPKKVQSENKETQPHQSVEKLKKPEDLIESNVNLSSSSNIPDRNQNTKSEETQIQQDKALTPVDETYYTIVCRYCNGEQCWRGKQPIRTADNLYKEFVDLPKQLLLCSKCPDDVKEKLKKFKSLRASQEAFLKRGAQRKYMTTVWSRLNRFFQQPPPVITSAPVFNFNPAVDAINEAGLLTEADRQLVTQFTFFTMEQMKPCSLEKSGNGARSMFHYGFPGLSCIHCAGTPSARKFFYRTADILSGNYAHIPNHVLACKHCPSHIKKELAEKKKVHIDEKLILHRGSQRVFFNNVWGRLHSRHSG